MMRGLYFHRVIFLKNSHFHTQFQMTQCHVCQRILIQKAADYNITTINRLGTMAELAIIICFSYNSHFLQLNFQRMCYKSYKNCRVAFCLVLQITANLSGSRKGAKMHSHRLLVFAPTVFLFWSWILVRIIYTWLTKSVFTSCIGLSL